LKKLWSVIYKFCIMKQIALYDEDVNSQGSIMPDYTYQPSVNTDFSNY